MNNSDSLRQRMRSLEETHRATLNILEDFDEEKEKYKQIQQATINLLEDFDEEREKFKLIQTATLNLLEDVDLERVKTEEAKALLESVNKELEAFSYSVSHDLRAPLRAISGFSEAIVEDCAPTLDGEGMRYFGLIQENAHKMGRLIDDLLAFSRLSRQELIKTELNLEVLARNSFEELMAQVPVRKINFVAASHPTAYGDLATIQQVLINLISNAIKFTRNREEARIEFGSLPDSNEYTYYIRDNGVGFDMRYANKLFGVFQRLHTVTEFEGTGIGLALVHRIINRHRGRVWAEGEVNAGATFYFTLPGGGNG